MHKIDLNCDMGEGFATDAAIMPFISSANIACGYHAGDDDTMRQTVALASAHHVAIGAHPGFADKPNFGRTEMQLPLNEVFDLVAEQVHRLQNIAHENGAKLHHVKPHGALYNMSARDALLADTIAKAVYQVDQTLVLFGLSGSYSISEAKNTGLSTASEVFADRSYQPDGSLTPRSKPGAMIESEEASMEQVLRMIEQKTVIALDGEALPIQAETICIHGDGKQAVQFAKYIFLTLQQHNIGIKTI
ncbi:MAG: 5-oxoprolinase subunit PxpA [Bacteroidota bacterium]